MRNISIRQVHLRSTPERKTENSKNSFIFLKVLLQKADKKLKAHKSYLMQKPRRPMKVLLLPSIPLYLNAHSTSLLSELLLHDCKQKSTDSGILWGTTILLNSSEYQSNTPV